MKRILMLLVTLGFLTLQSCSEPEGIPGKNGQDAPLSQVFEFTKSFTTSNNFSNIITFNQRTYESDVILAFRQNGTTSNGTAIWKPLPQTYYFANGTLDYRFDFDFTQFDVNIFLNGNDLATIPAEYRINQRFRIVIVPAEFKNKSNASTQISYNEAIAKYKIDESKIKILN
jgi:hypothetical protein